MGKTTARARGRAKITQVVSNLRTAAILDASRRVFAAKGFDAALVDDIAAEAGVAKGTIYLYFKSKLDIYRAALRESMAELAAVKAARVAEVVGTQAKLRAYVAATVEYCDSRRDFFRIFLVESGKLTSCSMHSPKELRELGAGQVAVLINLIESAQKEGEIHCNDCNFIAWTIGYAIRGMIERRLLNPAALNVDRDVETLLDFIWNGVRPAKSESSRRPASPRRRS